MQKIKDLEGLQAVIKFINSATSRRELRRRLRKHGIPSVCILCGRPAAMIGAFFPHDPAQLGQRDPAKYRAGIYALCDGHELGPELSREVEQVMEASIN